MASIAHIYRVRCDILHNIGINNVRSVLCGDKEEEDGEYTGQSCAKRRFSLADVCIDAFCIYNQSFKK